MPQPSVHKAVLAALAALAVMPTLAHATLVTTTSKTAFDVSNSVSDTLGAKATASDGAHSSTANTNMDTQKKATIAQFDKTLGVLTGATVNVASTYKQTTSVTVAGGGTAANSDGTFSATGSEWFESVVRRNFRLVLAEIPASRMTLATVFTQQSCPRATNSAWMRGLP